MPPFCLLVLCTCCHICRLRRHCSTKSSPRHCVSTRPHPVGNADSGYALATKPCKTKLVTPPPHLVVGTKQYLQAGLSSALPFIFFPVVVHAMDIVVSSVGVLFVTAAAHSATNPMDQLTRGYRWGTGVTATANGAFLHVLHIGKCFLLRG